MDNVILFLLIIIFCIVIAISFAAISEQIINKYNTKFEVIGGGLRFDDFSKDIVVDTLNLLYHIGLKPSTSAIKETIEQTTPIIKQKYSGITFVIKDKDTFVVNNKNQKTHNDKIAMYKQLAKDQKITIASVEQYVKKPKQDKILIKSVEDDHVFQGRDDYYAVYLAKKYKCKVLTNDNYSDAKDFKAIPPFHVYEYNYYQKQPQHIIINPIADNSKKYVKKVRPSTLGINKKILIKK